MDQARSDIYFDPDEHPDATLKAFDEFNSRFQLRYNALYPDPPKSSLDAAISRWRIENPLEDNKEAGGSKKEPTISVLQYDEITADWKAKDMVRKVLGIYSSPRLYADWCIAESDESIRNTTVWSEFVEKMKLYYEPTSNATLKHFNFRHIVQNETETFVAFCNRVQKESKQCNFNCTSLTCTGEEVAIRDQIVIGTRYNDICQEALKKAWDLNTLRRDGMAMESALKGSAAITGEDVNKVGKYSRKSKWNESSKSRVCYNCDNSVKGSILKHKEFCPAKLVSCSNCQKTGHFSKCCKSAPVKQIKSKTQENTVVDDQDDNTYSIDLFRINGGSDFKCHVVTNTKLIEVIADTGAKISVCSLRNAKQWGLYDKMKCTNSKIKPYKSAPIPVLGVARCAVTFGSTSVPIIWHIIEGTCDTILSGRTAEQLGIIKFKKNPGMLHPINMIKSSDPLIKSEIQSCLQNNVNVFSGIGKFKGHKVKLHVDSNVKPVNEPARSIPYHLQQRTDDALK